MLSEISAHAEHVLLTGSAVFGARNHHNFLASLSVKRSIRIERSFGQRGSSIAEVSRTRKYSFIGDVELVGRDMPLFFRSLKLRRSLGHVSHWASVKPVCNYLR